MVGDGVECQMLQAADDRGLLTAMWNGNDDHQQVRADSGVRSPVFDRPLQSQRQPQVQQPAELCVVKIMLQFVNPTTTFFMSKVDDDMYANGSSLPTWNAR